LLEAGARVVAIEKDPRFLPILDELARAAGGALRVVEADALEVDEAGLTDGQPAMVVSNLPYNVGTPLLLKWLTGGFLPTAMTLMFQKEVAQRIVAPPGGPAYGRLAVIAQATAEVELVMDVTARAFTPPPRVDSSVVRLVPRAARPAPSLLLALQTVTQAAFGQRRKMLRSSIRSLGGESLCEAAGLSPDARAETISVEGFLTLARAWMAGGDPVA
jgi:16S rRNA (adenine1518-N6/adenine1519-N6)-dimethyltransferase